MTYTCCFGYQWEVVFRYAADIGLSIMLSLNEDSILDNEEQHLYVREMVSRFGQYITAYSVGSLQMAQYIRALNGHQNATTSASILWRINTSTAIISLSDRVNSIDGILLLMKNASSIDIYDITKDWKVANPHLSIFVVVSIPVTSNTSQTTLKSVSDAIWSTLFSGGVGVLIEPSLSKGYDQNGNGVMALLYNDTFVPTDPSISAIRNLWEQQIASMTSTQRICNHIFVSLSNLRCLSDIKFTSLLIYVTAKSTGEVQIQPQFFLDSSSQYDVQWIDATTGTQVTTDITTISNNQTGLGTPPSVSVDWMVSLRCRVGCGTGS